MNLSLALTICPSPLVLLSHPKATTTLPKNTSPCPSFTISLFGVPTGSRDDCPHNSEHSPSVVWKRDHSVQRNESPGQPGAWNERHTNRAQTAGNLPEPINKTDKTTRFFNKWIVRILETNRFLKAISTEYSYSNLEGGKKNPVKTDWDTWGHWKFELSSRPWWQEIIHSFTCENGTGFRSTLSNF